MKILVAVRGKFSDAEQTVTVAASFPWPDGSEVRVVSVAEVIQPVMVGMIPDAIEAPEVQVISNEDAKGTAEQAALQFRSRGFHAQSFSVEGDPETSILEQARTWGADLIVVGSHNRSGWDKFLTGSVAESVVKHAPCSVLVLKHAAAG